MSYMPPNDAAVRFESLRRYGKLPRGRERRAQQLSDREIAAAILGFVSPNPTWAGHSTIVLGDLRPVGGLSGSFFGAANLEEALERLLVDKVARMSLLRLQVSGAERFENTSGSATLIYEADGERHRAFFVTKMAITLSRADAHKDFDADRLHSAFSREVSFNQEFFEEVARSVRLSRILKTVPEGDGSEYDSEEARKERYLRIGAGPDSNFLNVGVDNQVTWPREEAVVKFDRYTFVLMPKTNDTVQSIHVDLTANRLSDVEALTAIRRYLSIMAWCDDSYAIAQDGWSGNPVPVAVPRRDLAFVTTHTWCFDRKVPSAETERRALALYREARNAQQNFMVSYAVLNFYKIIEIGYHGKEKVRNWFRDHFDDLKGVRGNEEAFDRFAQICGREKPHTYIYTACRIAVAHANKDSKSDPDDSVELRRLHVAAGILHIFARYFISTELGISDSLFSGD